MSDRQDIAEALDFDKITDDDDYSGEGVTDYPPDEPVAVEDYGTTDAEGALDEPLEERDRRYEPDPLAEELDRAGGAGVIAGDGEDAELIQLEDDRLDEGQYYATSASIDDGEVSPEESALHVEEGR